jgi:hypothetical protein
MTTSPDPDRLIRAFLAEGDEILQDRMYDVVRAEIEQKPQRAHIGPWRISTMSRSLAIGAAALAVLAVVVIGTQLLGSPANFGGGGDATPTPEPTATAEPSAELSAAPSPAAAFPTWYPPAAVADANGAGILAAGSHETVAFSPGFTLSVPEGWVNAYDEANYFTLFPDTPANQAQFVASDDPAQVVFMGVHPTPWFTCESLEDNRGASAADMVAAASADEVLAVSDAVDVTIGGLTGMQFDVQRNPDWTGTCPGDTELPQGVDPEDERTRAILLDVPGRGVLVLFLYSMSSAEHEAFLAEAMPIVESFLFRQ